MGTAQQDAEFTAFVAARGRALLRTAYLLTGDHQAAEDLVQTALAKVYVVWPRVRAKEAVEAYVRRTMVTTHVSWWRRRWRGEVPTEHLPERPAPDPYASVGDAASLRAALDRLPRRQRAVVVLRYWEDLPEAEVADLLGCSVGTVKSQASRALAKLRADEGVVALREESR